MVAMNTQSLCIQGLTQAAFFAVVLVIICGKRGATQTAAVLSTEGQAVPSLSGQGAGSHLHASFWGLDAKPLRLLLMNASYPVVSKHFSFLFLKKHKPRHHRQRLGWGYQIVGLSVFWLYLMFHYERFCLF